MTANNSGAVFFLGSRAHYQVLQQPESRFDADGNGNASTESVYQNASVDSSGNYIGEGNRAYCDTEISATGENEKEVSGMKRRNKRRLSETPICDNDIEMKPAMLNNIGRSETPKSKPSKRINLLAYLTSLYKRKKRLDAEQVQYLQHIESVLQTCTYRECCRCLECQSRYFDVDESDYSSDESDYGMDYSSYYVPAQPQPVEEDDDDEVFVDVVPSDSTSTDLLIDSAPPHPSTPPRHSLSSEEDQELDVDIEVAAGTPVLLNYLLTHPVTCSVQ